MIGRSEPGMRLIAPTVAFWMAQAVMRARTWMGRMKAKFAENARALSGRARMIHSARRVSSVSPSEAAMTSGSQSLNPRFEKS